MRTAQFFVAAVAAIQCFAGCGSGVAVAAPTTAVGPVAVSNRVSAQAPPAERLTSLLREGRLANSTENYAAAEVAFRHALELQSNEISASNEAIATTLLDLALNVSNQGRTEEAQALFRRAEPLVQSGANPEPRARLATYQAIDDINIGDYASGIRYARDAVDQWTALVSRHQNDGDSEGLLLAHGELANALNLNSHLGVREDDLLAAYGAASHALIILNKEKGTPRGLMADTLVALGEVSVAQGRISAAEVYFKSAVAIRHQLFGYGIPTIQALATLGHAYQNEGLNTSAIVTYREVFRLARALPATAGAFTADMLVPFAAALVEVAGKTEAPEQRRGLFAEGFDAFQLVQSPVVDHTIAQAAARLSATTPAIGRLIGEMQDHQRAADLARLKIAHEQSLPDNERSGDEEVRLKVELTSQLAAATTTRRAIATQFPEFEGLVSPHPPRLDRVRALLMPHEGLLSFLIGRDRSFAQLVTRDGVTIAPVPEGQEALRDMVKGLRRALEVQGGAIAEFDLHEANRLSDDLLGGLRAALAGVDHLVVVPQAALANLPLALLVMTPPPEGVPYEQVDWLLRKMSLAYTPSLQAFVQLRSARSVALPNRALLGFGDPVLLGHGGTKGEAAAMGQLLGNCSQGGPTPAQLLRSLEPLPDTARELQSVAKALGAPTASLFMGRDATETNLRRQELSEYRVLYFATHGLLPGELHCQAEPGLVLTPPTIVATSKADDGLLESSEIASLRLNADLVVLSACNTAGPGGGPGGGEALSGLAEAFFHAGARNMVVSHWQVPSAATTELMAGMFKAWSSGSTEGNISDALRQSQLVLIANPRTAHPFFWAAFVAVGDGRGRRSGGADIAIK